MREVNKYLEEGLECKDLIIQKNREINNLDSSISTVQKINVNLNNEILIAEKKESKYKIEIQNMDKRVIDANAEKQAAVEKEQTQSQRKKLWRNISIGEAGFIVLILTSLSFILK